MSVETEQRTLDDVTNHPKLEGYDEPVLRAAGSERMVFHRPVVTDDGEVLPECIYDHADHYLRNERRAIEVHYEACDHCDWGDEYGV